MYLNAIEVYGGDGFFDALPIVEACCPERDVVGVPFAGAVVRVVGGRSFVDDGSHAVRRLIAVQDLDFVSVLEVDTTVASRLGDEEFDVKAKVAVRLFGDDIGSAIFAAGGGWVVGHEDRADVNWIGGYFPFDGEGGGEAWAFPIGPLCIEHCHRSIEQHLCAGEWFGTHSDLCSGGGASQGEA